MLVLAISALIVATYYSIVMVLTNGKTVGKYALGLRVITKSGERMEPVLMRELIAKQLAWGLLFVDTLVVFGPGEIVLLINYLWPLWQRQNRALHDLFAGTRVVREFGGGAIALPPPRLDRDASTTPSRRSRPPRAI